jgi:hypothetical protein
MKASLAVFQAKHFITLLVLTLINTILWAQQETTESSSSTKVTVTEEQSSNWYTQPWVWIVGAAIFLLLLIALLRSGGDRTVTHTDRETKVIRESDTDSDRV